jgi:hypothetical protein
MYWLVAEQLAVEFFFEILEDVPWFISLVTKELSWADLKSEFS